MANIVATILDYVAHVWKNTDQDIVMAENINGWENTLANHSAFLSRFAWHPNTAYPAGSVILFPFGLNTKLVSKNAGTSGSKEPTWSDATGVVGARTVIDNNIIWEERAMEVSADTTPIGTIKQQLWHTAPPGYLKLDTSVLLSRAEYPELWQFVQNYAPLISETDWQVQKAKQNTVAFFSNGDGSTNFRTPVIVDFARGGSVSSVGVYTNDQNKSHTHGATIHENGNHTHTLAYPFDDAGFDVTGGGEGDRHRLAYGDNYPYHGVHQNVIINSAGNHTHTISIVNSGGSEVLVRNVIMPYFLRILNI